MNFVVARQTLRLDSSRSSRGLVFTIVGGISAIISVGGTEAMYLLWHLPLWMGTIPMAQVAIFFKFYANRKLTWAVTDHVWRRFWMHEIVCLIALVAQTTGVFVAANLLQWPSLIALGVGVGAGLAINYLGNEFKVFANLNSQAALA